MSSSFPERPSSIIISIVVGIFVTVIGGVILAYVMREGRFASDVQKPQSFAASTPTPAAADASPATTPTATPSPSNASATNANSAPDDEADEDWTPGSENDSYPHVIASDEKDVWIPAPGYEWATKINGDLRVVWSPGKEHSNHPHVLAADTEGDWEPESGYEWTDASSNDFHVRRRDE